MIIDLRNHPSPPPLEADVCIVGGGAAGICIAQELAGSPLRVLLLEAGGLEFDPASQDVYRGVNAGLPYFALEEARLRFFGGTTNHWSGWCRPLDPIDFERRPWIEGSGWPISYAELEPYFARATRYAELPAETFRVEDWTDPGVRGEAAVTPLPLGEESFSTIIYKFSPPTRFGSRYRNTLQAAENVTVLLNAYVTELIAAADGGRITTARVAPTPTQRLDVQARLFVLATGGIENARILLLSRSVHTNGIGNEYDLVGRYFADHVELASGYVLPTAQPELLASYMAGRPIALAGLRLSPAAQARVGCPGCAITFHPVVDYTESSAGFGSLRRLVRSAAQGKVPERLLSDLANVVTDIDRLAAFGLRRALGKPSDERLLMIMSRVETVPNRESRVTLDSSRDAFGLNRVRLEWRLSETDKRSVHATQMELARALGRAGLGRVLVEFGVDEPWPSVTQGGYHHMGTTRMSDDPKTGVVDRHCRVHGLHNLYIAGSSTFRTTGVANPTLTILALALRIADRIKEELA
jgi:choline dehydrogenase-like flavoprotein